MDTGLDKMQKSTNAYIKGISKRSEIEGKEKILPIAHMGGTMISHGEDFEADSEMGQCLNSRSPPNAGPLSLTSFHSLRQNPGATCPNSRKLYRFCNLELA